jgi:hypothetical protein
VDEETKPKRAAADNPWFRLATLHGEPANLDDKRAAKNRETWNRWLAPRLPEELKAALLDPGQCRQIDVRSRRLLHRYRGQCRPLETRRLRRRSSDTMSGGWLRVAEARSQLELARRALGP